MTLKILWNSDRLIGGHSAYSKITYECCTRLTEMGYKMAHIPMGMANRLSPQDHKGVLVLKSGLDPFNEDVILKRYLDFKADLIIALKESWCFRHHHTYAWNFVPYCPIDHSPVSPEITSKMHNAFRVIVPSRFAQKELKESDIENVSYIPHGVDTEKYRPLEGMKEECKKLWFFEPDEFVVLMVSMNRVRKMNPRAFRGYKRFMELNPDVKTRLMFWGDMTPSDYSVDGVQAKGVADVGINLLPEVMNLGLGEAIRWPDPQTIREGIPDWTGSNSGWDMVKLYNAADCLLLCTGGEGFGMPLIEAQSCGVPVVTTDYAAGPEQVGAGLTVKADDYAIFNTPGARRALTSIDGMAEALTKIMNADPEKLARRARRFSLRYDWKNIMDRYFKPFLEDAERDLKPLITKEGKSTWV